MWWHNSTPPDEFLDVIGEFAAWVTRNEAKAATDDDSAGEFDDDRAAYIGNLIAAASPTAFIYTATGVPLFVADPVLAESNPVACFQPDFWSEVLLASYHAGEGDADGDADSTETTLPQKEIVEAAQHAWVAARWYDDFLDSSNRHFDAAGRQVVDGYLEGKSHPSARNVVDDMAGQPFGWTAPAHARALPTDSAGAAQIERDFQDLRCKTGRHSECRESYCFREKHSSKEVYCRFAEGLKIRGGEYGFRSDSPGDGDTSAKPRAQSHFYATTATAKDGTGLLRWQFHVAKEDPLINSCLPTHTRCFRSNCDAKACIDKYGVCQYITKVANYVAKA